MTPPSDGGSVQMMPPRSTPNDGSESATGVSVEPMPGMSYSGVRGAHQPAAVIDSRLPFSRRNLRILAELPSGSFRRSILSSSTASSSRRNDATTTYSPSPDTPRIPLIFLVIASMTSSMSARRCPDVTPGMSPPAVIVNGAAAAAATGTGLLASGTSSLRDHFGCHGFLLLLVGSDLLLFLRC